MTLKITLYLFSNIYLRGAAVRLVCSRCQYEATPLDFVYFIYLFI